MRRKGRHALARDRKATLLAAATFIEPLEPRRLLTGSISGVVFNDLNSNGVQNSGELGLAGWTVYLDQNRSRSLDVGEASMVTDANGAYSFTSLAAGTYWVGQQFASPWIQTGPGEGGAAISSGPMMSAPQIVSAPVPAITTTASDAPIFFDSMPAVSPADAESEPIVKLDQLRTDSRFAGADGHGYSIAVIDTGIDLLNPEFGPDADGNGVADRIVYQEDFADGDHDASDHNGHGSNVASIAAGLSGVAPKADIIALKVFGDNNVGEFEYIEAALQWVIDHASQYNISAVNMSLTDGLNWSSAQSLYGISDEMAALAAEDIIVISASGNAFGGFFSAPGVSYPAADANSLAIGAVYDFTYSQQINWGNGSIDYTAAPDRVTSFTQRSTTLLDALAPGSAITGAGLNGGQSTYSGTSQATPHVTGMAVIAQQLAMLQLGRLLTFSEFRSVLQSTGDAIFDGDDEDDNVTNTNTAFPRLNTFALSQAIYNMGTVLPYGYTVTLDIDANVTSANFGNAKLATQPTAPILRAASDTGYRNDDRITRFDNSSIASRLSFGLSNIFAGSTVTLYSDGAPIGSAVATGDSGFLILTTDGTTTLSQGVHAITARQQIPGDELSAESVAVNVTIDSIAPAAPSTPDMRTASDSGASDADNITRIARPIIDVSTGEAGFLTMHLDGQLAGGGIYNVTAAGSFVFKPAGALTFAAQPAIATSESPYSITAADVNGDGKLDLITTVPTAHTLSVNLGNGNGTFGALITTTRAAGPYQVSTADFNGDNKIDLLLTSNDASVSVLFGVGDGTFASEVAVPMTAANFVLDAIARDVNSDGKADIAAIERTSKTIRIVLGNGDGTFQSGISYATGDAAWMCEAQLADANGDSKLDIIVLDLASESIVVLSGYGDGTFGAAMASDTGAAPAGFATGDFDRDGKLDLMVIENGPARAHLLHGVGDGTFSSGTSIGIFASNNDAVAADFNLDGQPDFATSDSATSLVGHVDLFLGNGDGTFQAPVQYAVGDTPLDLLTADFNNDGRPDVVSANAADSTVSVLLASTSDLPDGLHSTVAWTVDLAGNRSPDSTTLSFVIDTAAPGLTIDSVASPRQSSLSSIGLHFTESVAGFEASDLSLTRDGQNAFDGTQGLTLLDLTNWSLSSIASATSRAGLYVLGLVSGAGVIDIAGNALVAPPTRSWLMNAIAAPPSGTVRLARSAASASAVDVFVSNPTTTPDYSLDLSNFGATPLLLQGTAGDETFTLDFASGPLTTGPGGIAIDAAGGSNDALAILGSTSADAFSFNSLALALLGGVASYAGIETVLFDGRGGFDTLGVAGSASVLLTNSQLFQSLALSGAGVASLAAGTQSAIVTRSLSIVDTARFDLADNALILDYSPTDPSPLATIRAYLAAGRGGTDFANATWLGAGGINSSTAANSDAVSFALGYAENSALPLLGLASYTTFAGQGVDSSTILIRYTRGADANLDGKVNTDDVTIIGADYNNAGSGQWYLGDFDYDGIVDTDDVTVLGAMYDATSPALAASTRSIWSESAVAAAAAADDASRNADVATSILGSL